jgi:porin
MRIQPGIAVMLLSTILSSPTIGQEEATTETEGHDEIQAGNDDLPHYGGPEGVSQSLKRDGEEHESTYQFDGLQRGLKPYFDWKRRIHDEHGVSLGLQFYALYQDASSSLDGRDSDAFGNIFRFFGNWTIFEQDNGNVGRIEWRFESRSNFGNFQAPGSLGSATGIAVLVPGFAYSDDFDLDIPILNWTQGFSDGRAGYAVGRLAFDVYLDAFPFQTFSRGYINRAFIVNPTMATAGSGAIGAVVKGFVSDNIWIGAQIYDANAASGEFDWDTVQEGEWLKAIEIGYAPSFAERNAWRAQLTYWAKDARTLAGVSKGSGWVVSATHKLNDKLFPFVRFGHSDGGAGVAAETAISAGVEVTLRHDRVWSVGAGWAKPSRETFGPGLDNETVFETSYKFQLSQNFSLTPDVQVVFNPANEPSESSVWIVGLRAIFSL